MSQLSPAQLLRTAIQFHQAGEFNRAETIYRQILAGDPRNPDAHHLLGVMAYQLRHYDDAASLIRRAIALKPNFPEAYSNLGNVLRDLDRPIEALAAYQHALALKPHFPDAHLNLGNVYKDLRQFDLAIAAYHQALALDPTLADAHNNLGATLKELGRLQEAIASCRHAIALKPDLPDAYSNLAAALIDQDLPTDAINACRKALDLNPQLAIAHYNLGCALQHLARLDEAQAAFSQALSINPRYLDAYVNLGLVLRIRGQYREACACFHQALALDPNHPTTLQNLGVTLLSLGQHDDAIAHLTRALGLLPDSPATAVQRGNINNNLANAYLSQARLDEAIVAHRRAVGLRPADAGTHSSLLFVLHLHPAYDAPAIYNEHRIWNQQHAQPLAGTIVPHPNDRSPDRRLRIGYVSPDFRYHCQRFFTLPLLSHHDHKNFEIFCYSHAFNPDAITTRLESCSDTWRHTIGLSDQQYADLVRQDQIDILVDLTMHMEQGRPLLFARKPAPVQVAWLAYPGTTGLTAIDYRLTDPYLDPPSPPPGLFDQFYSELSYRLPDTFWCYDPLATEPEVNSLPALSQAQHGTQPAITFGCLNNFSKINESVLQLWSRVMATVPHSRLVLLAPPGTHRQRVLAVLQEHGVAPDRVEFVARKPHAEYLALYHSLDLCLDTFPYNGHTTSLDSYWMGVPVVTLVGQTVVGRAGLSQLTNLGLTELIAHTPDQFVQIASDLAHDLPRLAHLRATLRQRMQNSPLMDAPRFARAIESAYRTMWRRWCAA